MKVVCVDGSWRERASTGELQSEFCFPNGWVVEGETYTVIEQCKDNNGNLIYAIAEKPYYHRSNKVTGGWICSRFVPLDYYNAEFAVKEEQVDQQPNLQPL